MSRYTGPVCRLCRREGEKLYLKGDRCYTEKCAVERRPYPPGQHGQKRGKISDYGLHLREKQKLRRIYGVHERQFKNYYEKASRKKGVTGEVLLQMLESRLDNVVYRLGFASSRPEARQIVLHGHIEVNGRKVNIPSYQVKPGDVIAVRERSKDITRIRENASAAAERGVPEWLELNAERLEGRFLAYPAREQLDIPVEDHLIVEYYSR